MLQTITSVFFMFVVSTAWSYTVSGNIYTTNGSQSDVQAAVNAAPDNGTVKVLIPDGTYPWTGTLNINKAVTLAGQSPSGVTINNNNRTGTMIVARSTGTGHIDIYWLNIVQTATPPAGQGFALAVDRLDSARYTVMIHDCSFNNTGIYMNMVACGANGILFWNDTFTGSGAQGLGGIVLVCRKYGPTSSWNTPSTMGSADTTGLKNTYIENCMFSNAPTACIDASENARVVVRYCTIQDSCINGHGQDTGMYGVRHYEIYNNTFINKRGEALLVYAWTYIRGGTFIIANNTADAVPWGHPGFHMIEQAINREGSIPCQTAYPAARQVGSGWSAGSSIPYGHPVIPEDGVGYVLDPAYIWNNSGANGNACQVDQYAPDDCGNGLLDRDFIVQNRDYYVGRSKPGWTPYTYPHPLHAKFAVSAGGTPAVSRNLKGVN